MGQIIDLVAGNDNGTRINNNVTNAIVLTNTNKGYFYSTTFKLEYPYRKGGVHLLIHTHKMICYLPDQLHQEAGMVYDQLTETMIRD
jgi:hypothetical protein